MAHRAVLWFRNDLRLRDNQLFHYPEVLSAEETIGVFCLDPRHFETSSWGEHGRLGPLRAHFLAESLEELSRSLETIGIRFLIVSAKPEDCLPRLLRAGDVLAYQGEDTSEEQNVEDAVCKRLAHSVKILTHHGHTLYHRDDLGFDVKETLPIPFGKFKFGICDNVRVRRELPLPVRAKTPVSTSIAFDMDMAIISSSVSAIEEAMRCGDAPVVSDPEQEPAIVWKGGEKAALERMALYFKPSGLGTYHRTRNQIQGASNSSHLSPWMANGCLSPRTVYWAAKDFEQTQNHSKDGFDHVYKFVFELNWRDYFRFYCAHFGKRVFFLGGPAKRKNIWRRVPEAEARWKSGCTGVPLVDALMRELVATGYIANRGRYVVACYLVHYLGIDWRVGADWFERHLLDHDVCSNYGEWASMANVAAAPTRGQPLGLKGRGPTKKASTGSNGSAGDPWKQGADVGFAIFDPWEQAKQYDKTETYVRRWLPELRNVAQGCVHQPHLLSQSEKRKAGCSEYPHPMSLEPFKYAMSDGLTSSTRKRTHGRTTYYSCQDETTRNGAASDISHSAWNRQVARGGGSYPGSEVTRNRRRWQAKSATTRVVYMET